MEVFQNDGDVTLRDTVVGLGDLSGLIQSS